MTSDIIEIIENIEFQLSNLKEALKKNMPIIKGEKKAFHSVREYEFCGMWKDRDEMIKELTLDYHRKRQDNITKEIIEVSSASEAL